MKDSGAENSDVLIVGAGPTGLLLTSLLFHHGLRARIIELGNDPAPASRAQVLQPRTLEILEQRGIVERFLERGQPLQSLGIYSQKMKPLFQIGIGESDTRYPFMLSLSQREIELLLSEHLAELGVPIERQTRLANLRQDDRSVTASVQRANQEAEEEIRSAWLVGCDGAHSTVREVLGLPFQDRPYAQRVVQADLRIDWPLQHSADEIICFISDEGPLVAFPLRGQHRYRLLAFENERAPSLKNFQRLLDSRGPKGAHVSDPVSMAAYAVHCRRAAQFRVGRVFLAGDAAHTLSPATGQGMNCGMQDAANLAWKLALVHKQQGRPILLDSYAIERCPAADALLNVTNPAMPHVQELSMLCTPLAPGLRDYLLRFITSLGLVQHRVSRRLTMLDVGYRRSAIVHQYHRLRSSPAEAAGGAMQHDEWPDFAQGPGAGERAFDGPVSGAGNPSTQGLFELLGAPTHSLLLFSGIAGSQAGRDRLMEIGKWTCDTYPTLVRPYLVQALHGSVEPSLPPGTNSLLLDQRGRLHRIYGARAECLYLIRPDGYVGYRSQPVELRKLADYLDRIFS
jgi:2-polyprenyl-6-methoxyphenol hydroxylase-like FAD-dependent oxidoreductase